MIIESTTRADLPLDADGLVVIDFYRDDCRFCDLLAPVLEDVAFQVPFATFAKVNCSHVDGVSDEFDVHAFPTTKLFKDGREVDSIVGFAPAEVLVERIGKHLYA